MPIMGQQQYLELRARLNAHQEWLEREVFSKGRNWYPVGACPPELRVTNEERSAVEVWEWLADPPERYFAYVDTVAKAPTYYPRITTWMGDNLGVCRLGRRWRSNFGDWRVSITVYGTNGVHYYGTFYESAGDYCRLRAYKGEINAPGT